MKKLLIGLLLIVSVLAAGCNQPTVEEANDTFCQSLEAFGDALVNLETISPTSTVGDLKDASAEVDKAWNQVTKSAKQLNDVKLDTIDESWKNLRRTINQVSDSDTLAAAAVNVGVSAKEIKVSYDQIGEVHCPGLTMVTESQEPANATQPAEAPAAEPTPVGFTGTYSTTLALAGVPPTVVVLVFNEDGTVFNVTRAVDQTEENILVGEWQDNGNATASVNLTTTTDGQKISTPIAYVFRLDGATLVAVQFDETVYGPEGFSLQRVPDMAVAAEAAAVAQQAITATMPLTTAVPMTTTATTAGNALLPADLFSVPAEPAQQAGATITTTAPLTATSLATTTEATALPADQVAAAAEPALAASPLGRVWRLQQITQTSGVNYTPDDPALYTVTFNADGTLNVTADCNAGVGTYQASESGMLTIDLVDQPRLLRYRFALEPVRQLPERRQLLRRAGRHPEHRL